MNWKSQLENFFNDKEIYKTLPESAEKQVGSFIEEILEPAFDKLVIELKEYGIDAVPLHNIKTARIPGLQLIIKGNGSPTFKYQPKYSLIENKIWVTVRIISYDNERKEHHESTPLNSPLSAVDQAKVIDDFVKAFTSKTKIVYAV